MEKEQIIFYLEIMRTSINKIIIIYKMKIFRGQKCHLYTHKKWQKKLLACRAPTPSFGSPSDSKQAMSATKVILFLGT